MKNKETLMSISRRTGYSVSTISRVLSGKAAQQRIAQKTVDIIVEEARRCNYVPDLQAKGLRTKTSGIVGLLVPSLGNPFFAEIANTISEIFVADNIHLMIGSSSERSEREISIIKSFIGKGVDGIIAVPSGNNPDYYRELGRSVPLILIDRYFKDETLDYVSSDNYTGGYKAAEYLIKRGYRDILVIQGDSASMPNMERVRGFDNAISDYSHLNIAHNISGEGFSSENGYITAMKALNAPSRPGAIFCLSVTIALGAIQAIHELGLKIPDDIGIITFDNNEFLDYLNPSVTRIAQPIDQICKLSCSILKNKMSNRGNQESTQILIKPTLIRGKSC